MGRDQLILADPRVYDQVFRAEGKYPIGAAEEVPTFNNFYEANNLTVAMKGASRGEEWKVSLSLSIVYFGIDDMVIQVTRLLFVSNSSLGMERCIRRRYVQAMGGISSHHC